MGMFDYIRCAMDLPQYDEIAFDEATVFQTKSLHRTMYEYLIDADGLLKVRELVLVKYTQEEVDSWNEKMLRLTVKNQSPVLFHRTIDDDHWVRTNNYIPIAEYIPSGDNMSIAESEAIGADLLYRTIIFSEWVESMKKMFSFKAHISNGICVEILQTERR